MSEKTTPQEHPPSFLHGCSLWPRWDPWSGWVSLYLIRETADNLVHQQVLSVAVKELPEGEVPANPAFRLRIDEARATVERFVQQGIKPVSLQEPTQEVALLKQEVEDLRKVRDALLAFVGRSIPHSSELLHLLKT